jgi:response regulator RpfG family c-di-GMP phosphodiesterase
MKQKKKKVLCIDSDPDFLSHQQKTLSNKNLEHCFFGFNDFWGAYHFLERQIIKQNEKMHYILLDEKILGQELLSSLNKLSSLKNYKTMPEVIVCTSKNKDELRNDVMQFPVVSAFLVKPLPQNYIEFLITGHSA